MQKMGPKKKGKGKVKKAKEPKLTRTEWLTKIAERNAILAAARKRLKELEDEYFDSEKRYEQTQEDLVDVLQYLQHETEQNEKEIMEFENRIAVSKQEIKDLDEHYGLIFNDLEARHEATYQELKSKIQVNEAKLSAFEEIRQQREEYLKRKADLKQQVKEMEARHEKELYEADKTAIIKQDMMQKEMDTNLTKLAVDFRQATDIAIGQTTNKLIKDNITLGNMLTCKQKIIEDIRNSYHKVREREKQYKYKIELLEEEFNFIENQHFKQINFIENLLKTVEELNEKIKSSRRLVKENRRLHRYITEKECILKEKKAELKDFGGTLKENHDMFDSVKALFTAVKRGIIKLEVAIFEASRTIKEGIEAENLTRVLKDDEGPGDTSKEEIEEALIEYKYKMREISIDAAIEKLLNGLLTESELQLTTQSSDFNSLNLSGTSKITGSLTGEAIDAVS